MSDHERDPNVPDGQEGGQPELPREGHFRPVIKSTMLSQAPRKQARLVATLSICVVTLASAIHWQHPDTWGALMEATPTQVFEQKQYWRIVTSFLIHRDVNHLASNCFPLAILAYHLYGFFGPLVYPVGTFLMGIAVTATALLTYEPNVNLLGISGVVYGMAGFWLTLFLFVERSSSPASRWLRAVGFTFAMLIPSQIDHHVSYRTHTIGMCWGIVWGVLYFLKNRRRFYEKEVVAWE